MDFKAEINGLISTVKGVKDYDYKGRLGQLPAEGLTLGGLFGTFLMFLGSFFALVRIDVLGYKEGICCLATFWGWIVFLLTLFVIIPLLFFGRKFWAAATASLCFLITLIQGIAVSSSGYGIIKTGAGFWFVLIGELLVIAAWAVSTFVFKGEEFVIDPIANLFGDAGEKEQTVKPAKTRKAQPAPAAPVEQDFYYCESCGAKVGKDFRFCPKCGTPRHND